MAVQCSHHAATIVHLLVRTMKDMPHHVSYVYMTESVVLQGSKASTTSIAHEENQLAEWG
eukprot:scaffold318805_cov39-Prasinocladus_malaysianus.AAC.1